MSRRDELAQVATVGCLAAIAFFVPFSIAATSLATGALLLTWLAGGNIRARLQVLCQRRLFLLFLLLYLVFGIAALGADNFSDALKLLETKLTLLVLPLIIGSITLSRKSFLLIFAAFVTGITILSAYGFARLLRDYPTLAGLRSTFPNNIIRDRFSDYTDLHPTYLSFFAVTAILITCYLLYKYWGRAAIWQKLAGAAMLLYMLLLLLALSSRMPQLALATTGICFGIGYVIRHKRYIILVAGAIMLVLFAMVLARTPIVAHRFMEIQETTLEPPRGIYHNSTNIRVGIMLCTMELLDQNWLLGLGTGNVQKNLNNCYQTNGYSDVLYKDNYGPHNVYLDAWLTAGIPALTLHLAAFLLPLLLALRQNHLLYVAFLLVFILCSLTESLLSSNKGIVTYALFNSLFALRLYTGKEQKPGDD